MCVFFTAAGKWGTGGAMLVGLLPGDGRGWSEGWRRDVLLLSCDGGRRRGGGRGG